MLLYDEQGLRLYDAITTEAPEYYLFGAEEEILKTRADDIVRVMHAGAGLSAGEVVLELGSGLAGLVANSNLSGSSPITYYALDLEYRELERTLGDIASSDLGPILKDKVSTRGMWGTYEDGLKFLQSGGLHSPSPSSQMAAMGRHLSREFDSADRDNSPDSRSSASSTDAGSSPPSTPGETQQPLHLLFLGSSLGNFTRAEGAEFLRSLPLRPGMGDTLLLGLDHDNDQRVIEEAYNDPRGHTEAFIVNGLKAAGRVLGDDKLFDGGKWEYVNFSDNDAYALFSDSGLRPIQRWTDSASRYSLWLLERPPFLFPLLSSPVACNAQGQITPKKIYSTTPFGIPSPQDWENLWAFWDFITRSMIPPSMLFQKPIDLRHICLFYLGHIPTFLDIHLSRLLKEPHSEPEEFKNIFEVSSQSE
uniref:Methyltransferase and sulfoxide synthase n=1 Tax=Flammulina velutipes TaxID=38945 RepID=A0A411H8P2_FLAVE|nr:methyltransferase and sulfoxide synthase [Flammulina velutipes]